LSVKISLVLVSRDPAMTSRKACHDRGAHKIHIDRSNPVVIQTDVNRVDDSQACRVCVEASFYDKLAPLVVHYNNGTYHLVVLLASRACLYMGSREM
jgi:hypothetical protein